MILETEQYIPISGIGKSDFLLQLPERSGSAWLRWLGWCAAQSGYANR
jgi:hypothetical protein